MTQERGAFIDALCAGNPAALREIRDKSPNSMARVAAVRLAEVMKENLDHPANAATAVGAQPGFVIVIQHADGKQETVGPPPQQPALIDVTPIEEPRRPLQREL